MIFISRLLVCWLLVVLGGLGRLNASDLSNPWTDLRPAHAVRCLGELRAALDAQPDDQRLLGLAIGAYVVLCLNGDPELDGAFGPWLERARELALRRRAARGQAAPASLEAAAPELWVRLIDGDATGVIAELERLPAETTSPHGLALRALATTDWRPLDQTTVRHALVDYARMVLMHRTWAGNLRSTDLIDPYVVHRLSWSNQWGENEALALPKEALTTVTWLLQSRHIDDATASAQAGQMLTALGIPFDPASGRAPLIAQLKRSIQTMAPDYAQVFAVAEHLALSYCDAEQGVRGKDGKHLLVGLGDMAQWVRSRLLDAAYFAYVEVWNRTETGDSRKFAERDRKFGEPLRQLLPDAVLTAQVSIGLTDPGFHNQDEDSPSSAADQLAKAIIAERARPHPLPDQQLTWVVAKLAKRRAELAQPIVIDLLAHWPLVDGVPVRTGLQELLRAAWSCAVERDLAQVARAAAHRWPADTALHTYADLFDPAETFFTWNELTPTATWIEPTINCRKDAFPHLRGVDKNFAITWEGWLQVVIPGRYEFKVVSDGYFKASIGKFVLAEQQRTQFRPDSVIRLSALSPAWSACRLPLRLDYEHRDTNGAECQLLWKPPGATAFVPIPPAVLTHGPDHVLGLSARALEARSAPIPFEQLTATSPAAFAWVATMPWQNRLLRTLGIMATSHCQYRRLIPLLRAARSANPTADSASLATCLLMATGADLDEGLSLIREHGFVRGDLPEQRLVISHLRDEGRLKDFVSAMQSVGQWEQPELQYLRTLVGLTAGDFAGIKPGLTQEIGDISLWVEHTELRPLCLLDIALSRMLAKPAPDFARLRKQAGIPNDQGYLTALDCLNGVADQPTIAGLSGRHQELVRWAAALLELIEGNHTKAQALLTGLVNQPDSDPSIAELSRDLLAWYASQTPESLAKVPKADPIKRRITAIKSGADDF